jgi:hypothetical protein
MIAWSPNVSPLRSTLTIDLGLQASTPHYQHYVRIMHDVVVMRNASADCAPCAKAQDKVAMCLKSPSIDLQCENLEQHIAPAAARWMTPNVNATRQNDVKVAGLLSNVIDELQQRASRQD